MLLRRGAGVSTRQGPARAGKSRFVLVGTALLSCLCLTYIVHEQGFTSRDTSKISSFSGMLSRGRLVDDDGESRVNLVDEWLVQRAQKARFSDAGKGLPLASARERIPGSNFETGLQNTMEPQENTQQNPSPDLFTKYMSPNMDSDSPYVPFASLKVCDAVSSVFFSADNDPTCMAQPLTAKGVNYTISDPFNYFRFWETKETRRGLLQTLLSRLEKEKGTSQRDVLGERLIMLMSFNIGFAHQFANWHCSLVANGVDLKAVQAQTLVLATDPEAIDFARDLGYFAPTFKEIQALFKWGNSRITREAAYSFAQGSHATLNMFLKFGMPADLIGMGYSVLVQDVDMIWTSNLLEVIPREFCKADECDAVFIHESRAFIAPRQYTMTQDWARPPELVWGSSSSAAPEPNAVAGYPEANTGMFLLRPSTPVKSLVKTLLEANRLQQWKQRDQIVWNSLLHHKAFSNVRLRFLPKARFVPGKYLNSKRIKEGFILPTKPALLAVHASDTSSYVHKFERLHHVGLWYFSESDGRCAGALAKCRSVRRCWVPMEQIQQSTLGRLGPAKNLD